MKQIAVLFLLIIIAMIAYPHFQRSAPPFNLEPLNSLVTDTCRSAERCVVVYVAPWCPSCNAALPLIKEIRSYCNGSDGRVGMRIVVGRDDREKVLKEARSIGGNVYLDPDGTFFEQTGANAVPSWFVWDAHGKVITEFAGSLEGPSMKLVVDEMIDHRLKLGSLM